MNDGVRLAAATAAAMLAFAGTAHASHDEGRGSPHDFVRGAGENIFATSFHINVREGPHMASPRGHFSYSVPGLPSPFVNSGVPTCLHVEGRRATFGGRLDDPVQTPEGPAGGVLVTVTDGGDPEGDGVTFYPVADAPQVCPPPTPVPDDALVSGDVTVHTRTR